MFVNLKDEWILVVNKALKENTLKLLNTYFAVTDQLVILSLRVTNIEEHIDYIAADTELIHDKYNLHKISHHKAHFETLYFDFNGKADGCVFRHFEEAKAYAIKNTISRVSSLQEQIKVHNEHIQKLCTTKLLMPIKYKNSFGEVMLTPVMNYIPVKDISAKKCSQSTENLITIDDSEKVALITENKDIQVSFLSGNELNSAYVIHHNSPSTAAICAVNIIHFDTNDNTSPADKINELAPRTFESIQCA